jgi:hypothetical protein
MKYPLLFFILLLAVPGFAQAQAKRIGEIEFFGYGKTDIAKLRAALPFHEGDDFSFESFSSHSEEYTAAIAQITKHSPTEIAPVCCDAQGNGIVFVGLSGKTFQYRARPHGKARLSQDVLELYDRWFQLFMADVQKGAAAEDHAKGYALSAAPEVRAAQLEMREYAVDRGGLLRHVLATADDDQQRIVAAHLLGYTRQSRAQILALVAAHRDSNGTVRNNATRALIVLAKSSQKIAAQIPLAEFVEQLLSGTWTDVNKSSALLDIITRGGSAPPVLGRPDVRTRLIEIARWRTSHGQPARDILKRLGIKY